MSLAQRIGRFHITRPLGSGSFSTVWLARDEELDGWVAIKILAENWSHNDDARRRFTDEARALRRLDDDRIVRVYDLGRLDDGRPYMVMEYADGGNLGDRMRLRSQVGKPFSVAEAVDLSMEMAGCLAAVHALRIVHRDLKPTNVLFKSVQPHVLEAHRQAGAGAEPERMLLGDFGIARRMESASGHTMVVGSPQYMAPEQADPLTAAQVDERSDVYSAAVILYELLTGRVPFPFDSPDAIRQASAPRFRPVSELRPDVPVPLGEAIERAVARDPRLRFATAWEWREALRDAMDDEAPYDIYLPPPDPDPEPEPAPLRDLAPLPSMQTTPTTRLPPRSPTDVVEPRPAAVELPAAPQADPFPSSTAGPAVRRLGPFDCSFIALVATLLLLAAPFLPWRRSAHPSARALGLDLEGAQVMFGCALGIGVPMLVRMAFRRRWTVALLRFFATLAGLTALGLVLVQGWWIHLDLGRLADRGIAATYGVGLYLVAAGGAVALVAALRAGRQYRRTRPSPLTGLRGGPQPGQGAFPSQ